LESELESKKKQNGIKYVNPNRKMTVLKKKKNLNHHVKKLKLGRPKKTFFKTTRGLKFFIAKK